MRCAVISAMVALCFAVLPPRGWGQVHIPGPGEGYEISKSDSSQPAPPGFEGRTDTSMQTAKGVTPATASKTIVTKFTMGNQVETCPDGDGTVEGTGLFSISVDYKDEQANPITTLHIEMQAKAKYKGEVSEDAYLEGPVYAEIDYSYNQSGSIHDRGGAIATPAVTPVEQHIKIPFFVSKDMTAPTLGAFSGGDPTQGNYSEAFSVGTALTYWAGIYYSVAEFKWLQGQCVQVVFNPPSYTLQPVLGGQTTVKAEVKTKSGETVRGHFQDAKASAGGVDPLGGLSDVGYPIKFTYTAPDKKVAKAGFGVNVTSRAGMAGGEWDTGLGTGWSGQISCTRETSGDEGHSDPQTWSNFAVDRVTISVRNGGGEASGHSEVKTIGINRRSALRGGTITFISDNSQSGEGSADGTAPATVDVTIDKVKGTYSISAGYAPMTAGREQSVICIRDTCKQQDLPFGVQECLPGEIGGKLDSPNHLSGSQTDVTTGLGRAHNGKQTYTLTWDLARSGSD